MSRLNPRHRLLLGVLALAAGAWGIDAYTRGGTPRSAVAQGSSASAQGGALPQWEALDRQIAQLTGRTHVSLAEQVARLRRDVFLPAGGMELALQETLTASADPESGGAGADPRVPLGFEDRHVLVGVVLGSHPYAVIDDRVYTLYTVVDEHQLIEIQRDRVVLVDRQTRDQVILELPRGPEKP